MNKDTNPIVSVIVPIYNVETYLQKCVDSILSQTYSNLEVILVDDGSKDKCPQLCDTYKEKDERVKVIHKVNGGLSDARNAGLDAAIGQYITFIDGDDYYDKNAIEILVKLIIEKGVQISCMRNASVSSNYLEIEDVKNTNKVCIFSSHKLLKLICNQRYSTSVCNKLFDRKLWDNKRFTRGRLNEDFLALCDLLLQSMTVATIEYAGYFYYTRFDSITHLQNNKYLPVMDALENSIELFKKTMLSYPKLKKNFARIALYQARTLLLIMPNNCKEYDTGIMRIENCLKICKKYILFSYLRIKDKMILFCACINLKKTYFMLHRLIKYIYGENK